jgi:predicted nucleic acid-binding protein
MPLVVDPSAIASLAFPDEDNGPAVALIETMCIDLAVVPTLFWFEIRNILLVGERRSRLTAHQSTLFLSNLAVLPFEIDQQPNEAIVLGLARQHALTVYDASYLELALRRNLSLATLDRALIRAAETTGVARWNP